MTQRIVALIDMDCFYCQVESRVDSNLKGKPMAVVQYKCEKHQQQPLDAQIKKRTSSNK